MMYIFKLTHQNAARDAWYVVAATLELAAIAIADGQNFNVELFGMTVSDSTPMTLRRHSRG